MIRHDGHGASENTRNRTYHWVTMGKIMNVQHIEIKNNQRIVCEVDQVIVMVTGLLNISIVSSFKQSRASDRDAPIPSSKNTNFYLFDL